MKKLLTLISLLAFVLAGCTEFEEPSPRSEKENNIGAKTRSATQYQYQINLDNPYSLQNVQEALDIVVGTEAPHLTATHHYVRFLPQDSMDMYILVDSLDLDIFPYPFDYDLTPEEMYTHEKTLINGYAWQYCLVSPTFQMPTEMAVEILDYAYLQSDEPGTTRAPGEQLDPDVYGAVIDKAMEITGYATGPQTRASAWQPSATITYDSGVAGENEIKLKNVLVRANTTFNSGEGYTDANGKVTISKGWGGKFKNATQYKIIWKNDKWKIRDRGTGKAKYEGPKQKSHWDFHISGDNETAMHATIHRALNAYYYENHLLAAGLVKNNGLNVRALWNQHDSAGSAYGYFYWIILGMNVNDIYIYGDDPSFPHDRRLKYQILSTTFHELGHASHYRAVINTSGMNRMTHYKNAAEIVKESWARGVQYAYMKSIYPNNSASQLDYFGDYTAIVESLMNQGLTLQQLQSTVVGKTTWEQWRTAVKALRIIPSQIVDMLFDYPCSVVRTNISNNVISGPVDPSLNTTVTYTVPVGSALPSGMSFAGLTVSGGQYTIVSNTGGKLQIKFTSQSLFNITATYKLPDGSNYICTKSIDKSLPAPYRPTFSERRWNQGGPNGMLFVEVSVKYPQTGASYEWVENGVTLTATGPSINVAPLLILNPGTITKRIKCKARLNGMTSEWSEELVVVIVYKDPGSIIFQEPVTGEANGEDSSQDSAETGSQAGDGTDSQAEK